MSFFDDASLAFLPSGAAGKDGKAYSIKPTDGTGDFTFSRGSNLAATRVGADGLIEKGRENLLTYSNDFSNADWLQVNTTLTSGQSGYDGSSNAWKIEAASTGTIRLRQLKNISANSVITMSVYAKIGNVDFIKFNLLTSGTNSIVTFDLTDGTTYSSNAIDEKWESVGGGWVRISATFVNSLEITEQRIEVRSEYDLLSAPAGSFVYIQDAQLEQGLAATDYIESGATTGKAGLLEDEPRFDYSGGATCPSLLLEPSRTQLVAQTEYFGDGYWVKTNASITSNSAVSPSGITNAAKLIEDATNAQHKIYSDYFVSVAGDRYAQSFFAKSAGRNWVYLEHEGSAIAWFNLSNGTIGTTYTTYNASASIQDYGNGWYRCIVSYDANDATSRAYIGVTNADNTTTYLGDGSSGAYIWGAQLEQGSYPTSYIPNHSGTGSVTRGADEATGAGDASTFNDSEGVLYAEVSTLLDFTGGNRAVSISDSTTNNRITFIIVDSNQIQFFVNAGGSFIIATSSGVISDLDLNVKIAVKYKSSDYALWINGTEVYTSNISSLASGLNVLQFNSGAGSSSFYGNAKQVLYFPTALSDADLETLTTL